MRLRRTMVWVMIGALVLGFSGIGWNLVYLDRNRESNERVTALTCDDLRAFIVAEEKVSLQLWKKYHREVMAFAEGLPKAERPAKVNEIAMRVSTVLESDLRIYQEMKKLPQCLDPKFREKVQEWISTTKEMISYLAGEGPLAGNYFDPDDGFWDTSFYDAFYSATDNLISGLKDI